MHKNISTKQDQHHLSQNPVGKRPGSYSMKGQFCHIEGTIHLQTRLFLGYG